MKGEMDKNINIENKSFMNQNEIIEKWHKMKYWRSVKDRLPNNEQQVLAGYYDKDGKFQQFMDVFNSEIWSRKKSDFERYTHWMPLPEPPK